MELTKGMYIRRTGNEDSSTEFLLVLSAGDKRVRVRELDTEIDQTYSRIVADSAIERGMWVESSEAEYIGEGEMTDAEIVPTIMEVTENPVAFEIPEPCACGCGTPAGKDAKFVPGHDQKLRSRLLIEFDHGSDNQRSQSRERLVGLGWYTEADLDERDERNQSEANSKADKIRARIEKLNVKMAKLTEDIAKLETQLEIEEFRSER